MKILFPAFAGAALNVSAAIAAPVNISCTMTDTVKSGGWIPRQAVLQYDVQTKAVALISPTENQLNGKVGRGKVSLARKDRVVLNWEVTGARDSTGRGIARFRFTARYNPETGEMTVIAKPKGYTNDFRSSGTCQKIK